MKPIVGLTGGIGSGKSVVAGFLRELGVGVLDADQVARDVVAVGSLGLAAIVTAFGKGVLDCTGALDRKRVAEVVFADAAARKRLESIVHPRVAVGSQQELARLAEASQAPYVVYEVPLLVENGMHRAMAAVVVVTADLSTQLARVMARDGMSEEQALARVRAQLPLADKAAVADFLIANQGSLAGTRQRTLSVHEQLTKRFQET